MFISFFFFKQKTAYEMVISDWSSDVCSSDLSRSRAERDPRTRRRRARNPRGRRGALRKCRTPPHRNGPSVGRTFRMSAAAAPAKGGVRERGRRRRQCRIGAARQIGRAHVLTPVTNAHLVCRLLLEKKNE